MTPTEAAIAAASTVIAEYVMARNAASGAASHEAQIRADAGEIARHLAECGMLHI